ncbi:nucleotide exchange factors-like protein [Abortiporus biennis]|nr:nucleotide exchange factors-like protein [Abortiporus biennis]
MESLLRWGIEHSAGQPAQPAPRLDLDPGIIDAILGKPDAELMKEALAIALDESKDEDDRIQALDDFEMLIESIDNANDLEKLKMWEPIHKLLISPTSTDGIKRQVLWIIGTAVQNNPSAQTSYLALSPLPTLLSFLSPSVPSEKTRSKAVYAISGLLKHNAHAVRQLAESNGWESLKGALEDSDISVRRKVAFLLNALLIPNSTADLTSQTQPSLAAPSTSAPTSTSTSLVVHPTAAQPENVPQTQNVVHPNSHMSMLLDPTSYSTSEATRAALEEHGILNALVDGVVSPVPYGPDGESEGDHDFEEKTMSVLKTYLTSCNGKLPEDRKKVLSGFFASQSEKFGGEKGLAERWGMTGDEVGELKKALA